jgi:hypothetical protein
LCDRLINIFNTPPDGETYGKPLYKGVTKEQAQQVYNRDYRWMN